MKRWRGGLEPHTLHFLIKFADWILWLLSLAFIESIYKNKKKLTGWWTRFQQTPCSRQKFWCNSFWANFADRFAEFRKFETFCTRFLDRHDRWSRPTENKNFLFEIPVNFWYRFLTSRVNISASWAWGIKSQSWLTMLGDKVARSPAESFYCVTRLVTGLLSRKVRSDTKKCLIRIELNLNIPAGDPRGTLFPILRDSFLHIDNIFQ